ncbi:MAG: hypothetical protein KAR20_03400, partial [Candidatus Heimdallarchaeota archaeon]|nr:hypothetical protein [Candidatus Heimdallarchaeota archaeon]
KDDKTLTALIPLLRDDDEKIRAECADIFRKTEAKIALHELEKQFDIDESTLVKLHIIYAVYLLDNRTQQKAAEFVNDVIVFKKNDVKLRDYALEVAGQIKDKSSLEIILKRYKPKNLKGKLIYLSPLVNFHDDERVNKIFLEILTMHYYTEEFTSLAIEYYCNVYEPKAIKLILKEIKIRINKSSKVFAHTSLCFYALGNIGNKDTIAELEKLKKKHVQHSSDIDKAIASIKERLK